MSIKTIDLTEIFSSPTPAVSQPTADFEEQPQTTAQTTDFTPPAAQPQTVQTIPADDDADELPMDPEEIADMIVDGVDVVQQYIYPLVYDRLLFTKEEKTDLRLTLQKIKQARRENKVDENGNVTIALTAYEQNLLEKQDESIAYDEELVPLTEKEQRWLKKPLTKLLAKSNYKVSPLSGLIVAAVIITLPRLLPMFGIKRNKQ